MRHERHVSDLPSDALLIHTRTLAADERHSTAALLEALAEIDKRGEFRALGYNSMFAFCTRDLLLSEGAAYERIEAARAVRLFPCALKCVKDGSLTVTNLRVLMPVLTRENHVALIDKAKRKTKDQVVAMLAELRPRRDVAPMVRRLVDAKALLVTDDTVAIATPQQSVPAPPQAPATRLSMSSRAVVAPLSPARYKIQCTVDQQTHDDLRRLQSLMRHQVPNGDPAAIIKKALATLRADVEKRKLGAVTRPLRRPRPTKDGSRHVPQHVRREVWKRDGGQCRFVGSSGRCEAFDCLELHHVVPFARGGETSVQNLELRCRTHNHYEAEVEYGAAFMRDKRGAGPS